MSPTKLCASFRECNKAFISGSINSIPCTQLLVDNGCEITSSSLVPPTYYTGKSVLLQSIRSSDKGNFVPLAKVHLKIDTFDSVVEVAVCTHMTDEALLGSDLGLSNLSQWLKSVDSKSMCQTQTPAQEAVEHAQTNADNVALTSSEAEVHSLGDIFNFEDDFFCPKSINATPLDSAPSELPLPDLTLDSSDRSLLVEEQRKDSSLQLGSLLKYSREVMPTYIGS